MGIFSKLFSSEGEEQEPQTNAGDRFQPVPPTVGGELTPLTIERIAKYMDDEEFKYGLIDANPEEGTRAKIESGWEGIPFLFNLNGEEGEILTVFSQSPVNIPLDHEDLLDAFIENWHREHYFPKVYTRKVEADTALRVCCEHSIDFEDGCTDKQLALQIHCGIATSLEAIKGAYEELGISLEEDEN
ncbi:YbjN domain-containing protein [Gleimia sp. 6138-11-ORH1]|uniref:YbjN domain-containing protein n=1 Tax=Gleimia sp. 6138-11-ORH1 TaxID=2973937 RepID=UPI002167150B|nr:YbjN domain-containing protein [Gleimia sp. 6138-11-ORH1]MCS4483968.1 YbjN domain-containing protein [Gleimia sp. 6138-11-ORH1]